MLPGSTKPKEAIPTQVSETPTPAYVSRCVVGSHDPHSLFPSSPLLFLFLMLPHSSVEPTTERPGRLLWIKSLRRLRTHIRVVSAFQDAANLHRRASLMSEYALTASASSMPFSASRVSRLAAEESSIALNIPTPAHAASSSYTDTASPQPVRSDISLPEISRQTEALTADIQE
jgi:hypothetical protein